MQNADSILFIDDEVHVRRAAEQTLELAGLQVHSLNSADGAFDYLSREWPGIVISDVRMPGIDGLELLSKVQDVDPDLPVVLITGHGDISMAVQAIHDGAYDFIEKPFSTEQLLEIVRRALEKRSLVLENRSLHAELRGQTQGPAPIIGRSAIMERLRAYLADIGPTNADVLILGETGTGKELVARNLHLLSDRHSKPFVALNCAAIPESIMESELFGHEAGTFTGAGSRHIGKFEYANGGTVFLDEIESMPPAFGAKLLRVLQERAVVRLGSHQLIPLDIRVVAATKTDLKAASAQGEFREDLYYRLNVVEIRLPALRERREDIPLLFEFFAQLACGRYQRSAPPLGTDTFAELMSKDWPGNVRELRNAADRYVLGCLSQTDHRGDSSGGKIAASGLSLPERVEQFERALIAEELTTQEGKVKQTYTALGLPRKTFYDKVQKHGINLKDFR